MWCIYRHISPSNKSYIGITSQNPLIRWKNGAGYDKQTKFGKAIQKYGWDNFTHEIIEDGISTLEEAREREKHWISVYDTFKNGYNSTLGGECASPDLIVKIPVYQIDENMKVVAKYDSYIDAAENTGISNNNICSVIKGHQITAGGYYWCREVDYTDDWEPRSDERTRPVICIETQTIYPTQTAAAQDAGINNQESISYCCLRQSITAGGFHWAFADEYDENWQPVEAKEKDMAATKKAVICIETGETYDSVTEAARKNYTSRSGIRRACNDHSTANGKHFAYLSEYDAKNWRPHVNKTKNSSRKKSVICIETGVEYPSTIQAGESLKISPSLISQCCNGKIGSAHKLHFIYKEC